MLPESPALFNTCVLVMCERTAHENHDMERKRPQRDRKQVWESFNSSRNFLFLHCEDRGYRSCCCFSFVVNLRNGSDLKYFMRFLQACQVWRNETIECVVQPNVMLEVEKISSFGRCCVPCASECRLIVHEEMSGLGVELQAEHAHLLEDEVSSYFDISLPEDVVPSYRRVCEAEDLGRGDRK